MFCTSFQNILKTYQILTIKGRKKEEQVVRVKKDPSPPASIRKFHMKSPGTRRRWRSSAGRSAAESCCPPPARPHNFVNSEHGGASSLAQTRLPKGRGPRIAGGCDLAEEGGNAPRGSADAKQSESSRAIDHQLRDHQEEVRHISA